MSFFTFSSITMNLRLFTSRQKAVAVAHDAVISNVYDTLGMNERFCLMQMFYSSFDYR